MTGQQKRGRLRRKPRVLWQSTRRLVVAVVMAKLYSGAAQSQAAQDLVTYTNPVVANGAAIHMGDPFAFRAKGRYFLTGTSSPDEGFRIYESVDLVHWTDLGWALRKKPGFWSQGVLVAPEVRLYRGKYYLVYAGMPQNSRPPRVLLGLAVSDVPQGPYRSLYGPWFDPGYSAIDGDIFVDDDGTPYVYFSKNGQQEGYAYGKIYGARLSSDLSHTVGNPVELMEASQAWERVNWDKNRCNEGPTVFRRRGTYYMTYSANDTDFPTYGIGYATATNPLGPWTKSAANPILESDMRSGVSGPGHNSIVTSPDGRELFIVYHSHADSLHPSEDRVVNIDRLIFDHSGKLRVAGPTRSPQPMPSH